MYSLFSFDLREARACDIEIGRELLHVDLELAKLTKKDFVLLLHVLDLLLQAGNLVKSFDQRVHGNISNTGKSKCMPRTLAFGNPSFRLNIFT